jgi:hypothetical protein
VADRSAEVDAFWRAFAGPAGVDAPYDAWAFGGDDTPELATELGLLVRDGPKRATTALLADHERDGEPLPAVGGYSVILDGSGEPLCIVRTTAVDTKPFGEVDEEFAWVEGEGDRSLSYWREAHIRFFANEGTPISDDDLVVLERFELVWPRPHERSGSFAMSAASVPLVPGELSPSQVLAGSPEVTEAVLSESADGRIVRGIWRITEGTVTDVEQDELFVVLEGRATIEIDGGPTLEVGPGDVCVLERGARTTWTVHEALRKVFQITLHDGDA